MAPGSKIKHLKCKQCGKKFKHWHKKTFCSDICKTESKPIIYKTSKEKIETQNRLWLENNQPKDRLNRIKNKLSYDEMQRRAEYERVYGKEAWMHFCKGRKWDKI
jgi:hypothetical protein